MKDRRGLLLAIFVNTATILAMLIMIKNLPPEIPLFFGRPQSINQLAPKAFILFPPAISILLTLVNLFLVKIVNNSFLEKTLIGISFTMTILSTIAVIRIAILVGSF
mgnify:CR=1 FL=1